jgi:hypothetical protein
MKFARLSFGGMGVVVLVLLAAFGISSCYNPKTSVVIACGDVVTIDAQSPHGVIPEQETVYFCKGHTITWKSKNNEIFTVMFDPNDCPLTSCSIPIDNKNPQSIVATEKNGYLHVYKYTVSIRGIEKPFDPHGVGTGR